MKYIVGMILVYIICRFTYFLLCKLKGKVNSKGLKHPELIKLRK